MCIPYLQQKVRSEIYTRCIWVPVLEEKKKCVHAEKELVRRLALKRSSAVAIC